MKRLILVAIMSVFLAGAGCQSGGGTSATPTASPVLDHAAVERAAFEARAAYGLAATVAANYVELPLCTKSTPPCATPAVVLAIQRTQPTARAAIDAAMSAARDPNMGTGVVNTLLASAQASLTAFTTITNSLPKK